MFTRKSTTTSMAMETIKSMATVTKNQLNNTSTEKITQISQAHNTRNMGMERTSTEKITIMIN